MDSSKEHIEISHIGPVVGEDVLDPNPFATPPSDSPQPVVVFAPKSDFLCALVGQSNFVMQFEPGPFGRSFVMRRDVDPLNYSVSTVETKAKYVEGISRGVLDAEHDVLVLLRKIGEVLDLWVRSRKLPLHQNGLPSCCTRGSCRSQGAECGGDRGHKFPIHPVLP